MADFHCSVKVIKRSAGRSATAAAAYRSGTLIYDETTNTKHNYTAKGGVIKSEIMAPKNAPAWVNDRSKLWNAVEKSEKRVDAQLAREIVVGLPHELNEQQRMELTRGYVQACFVNEGMIADIAFHEPGKGGDQRNFHAHIMLTMREIGQDGFDSKKNREWNAKTKTADWRKAWEVHSNRALEAAGVAARVDCRSLVAQRAEALEQGNIKLAEELNRLPQIHLGPRVTEIVRSEKAKGRDPIDRLDRYAANEAIKAADPRRKPNLVLIKNELADITREKNAVIRREIKSLDSAIKSKVADFRWFKEVNKAYEFTPQKYKDQLNIKSEINRLSAASKKFKNEHPLIAKVSEKTGVKLKFDVEIERLKDELGSTKEGREWFNRRDEYRSELSDRKSEIQSLVAQRNELREELANDRDAAPSDLKHVSEKLEAKAESGFKGLQQIARSHPGANQVAGISAGLQAGSNGDIIRTGVKWADELAQEFKQFCEKQEAEALARAKAFHEIKPDPGLSKGLQDALEALFYVAVTLETGENHVEPGEPLRAQKLAVYADSALRQVNTAKSSIVRDVNSKQIMEERRRELAQREVERKKAEAEQQQQRKVSKYKKGGNLEY